MRGQRVAGKEFVDVSRSNQSAQMFAAACVNDRRTADDQSFAPGPFRSQKFTGYLGDRGARRLFRRHR